MHDLLQWPNDKPYTYMYVYIQNITTNHIDQMINQNKY